MRTNFMGVSWKTFDFQECQPLNSQSSKPLRLQVFSVSFSKYLLWIFGTMRKPLFLCTLKDDGSNATCNSWESFRDFMRKKSLKVPQNKFYLFIKAAWRNNVRTVTISNSFLPKAEFGYNSFLGLNLGIFLCFIGSFIKCRKTILLPGRFATSKNIFSVLFSTIESNTFSRLGFSLFLHQTSISQIILYDYVIDSSHYKLDLRSISCTSKMWINQCRFCSRIK